MKSKAARAQARHLATVRRRRNPLMGLEFTPEYIEFLKQEGELDQDGNPVSDELRPKKTYSPLSMTEVKTFSCEELGIRIPQEFRKCWVCYEPSTVLRCGLLVNPEQAIEMEAIGAVRFRRTMQQRYGCDCVMGLCDEHKDTQPSLE
jgi:hypothetical protein